MSGKEYTLACTTCMMRGNEKKAYVQCMHMGQEKGEGEREGGREGRRKREGQEEMAGVNKNRRNVHIGRGRNHRYSPGNEVSSESG